MVSATVSQQIGVGFQDHYLGGRPVQLFPTGHNDGDIVVVIITGMDTSKAMKEAGHLAHSVYIRHPRTGEEMTILFMPRSQAELLYGEAWELMSKNNVELSAVPLMQRPLGR